MITIKEYIENPGLLEGFYTPYQTKCQIVDTIIDQLKLSDKDLWIIDYAQLKPIKDSIFISQITNLDMTTGNEEGLLGYDYLKSERKWDGLINSIRDEYEAFDEILELKLQTIKDHNSEARILNEFREAAISAIMNIGNVNVSELMEKMNKGRE